METSNMETMNLHTTDAMPNRESQCVTEFRRNSIATGVEAMSSRATSALPNIEIRRLSRFGRRNINSRVLERVERELEKFEKISLLFLLAAEMPGTYKRVLAVYQNMEESPGVIARFIENNLELWDERLVEALCIVGNREILRNLGYSPSELAYKYHPDIASYTVRINAAAKVLYKLFESMERAKTKEFLRYIYDEDRIERQLDDSHYLELHALYWLHIDYITISRDGGNLSNLLKHIKRMNYYGESIYHDIDRFSTSSSQSDSWPGPTPALQQYPDPPTQNDPPSTPGRSIPREIRKGKCVIINEVRFPPPYERRDGSDTDRDALEQTFSAMGFDIVIREDLTEPELINFFKEISDVFDTDIHDCLIVCILSHGYKGGIVTSDGREISNGLVDEKICTPKLSDTIKLLIVQACQGKSTGDATPTTQLTTDGSTCESISRHRNFAKFMSTIVGFASIRHKIKGSWFIESLCEVLSRKDRVTISELQIAVNRLVGQKKGRLNGAAAASQISEFTSRLTEELYFPRIAGTAVAESAASARQ